MNNLRKYGNPPFKIALIHGGPGAAGEMVPVARELSSKLGILEPLQTKNTIEGQLNELKSVLEKNATPPVTLIGFSWGAWLSLILASKYPELTQKLILISSGPFEEKYAENIQETRLNRLSKKEKSQVTSLIEYLNNPEVENKNELFEKTGKLLSKADAYEPIEYPSEIIDYRYGIFQSVWKEASELRTKGMLLEYAKNIKCPVVAIHGDYDPHPAVGVQEPLSSIISNFRFILLEKCGHKPWIEKHARDKFYKILKQEL